MTRLILGVLLITMVALSFSFGITYDEVYQQEYGEWVYRFFSSGFTERHAMSFGNLYLYGGVFELTCNVAQRWLEGLMHPYQIRHVVNSIYSWVGMLYTFRLGRTLGGSRAGWIALALLVASPLYFGHGMNNPKDIPFATFHVMALYYFAVLAREYPAVRVRTWIGATIAMALALNVRAGGMILLPYLALLLAALTVWRLIASRRLEVALHLRTGLIAAVVVPLTLVLGTVFWPWALWRPLVRPFEALAAVTHFEYAGGVLFAGHVHSVTALPWNYAAQWFLVTTPLSVLFGVASALVLFTERRSGAVLAGLLFAIAFPLAYVVYRDSVLYDGVRHLLFVYPPLVVGAALGIDFWLTRIPRRSTLAGWAFVALCAGLAADAVWYSIVNHPHQSSYFNPLVGGTRGAFGRYEQDYWASCFKQGIEWLEERAREEGRSLRVLSSEPRHVPRLYATQGLEFVDDGTPHEYVLTWMRGDPDMMRALNRRPDIVYRVTADGAPLCVIFKTTENFPLPTSS